MKSFDFAQAPGHIIRRAHQVSAALFASGASTVPAWEITQVQFAMLNALIDSPGMDQVTLAQKVALDAATSGSVIARLESRGWLCRVPDQFDRRRRLLWITESGQAVVAQLFHAIAESQRQLMAPLSAAEQQELMRLLGKLVQAHTPATSTAQQSVP
jgi:DNA-binding MarR family transcriptional regulator